MYNWNESVVIKDRERDVQVLKNVKVYFKWGWTKSPFDIDSVVFHFEDFNYGRRSQPYFC
jgi:histidinol phosphatase-like enzyme